MDTWLKEVDSKNTGVVRRDEFVKMVRRVPLPVAPPPRSDLRLITPDCVRRSASVHKPRRVMTQRCRALDILVVAAIVLEDQRTEAGPLDRVSSPTWLQYCTIKY